MACNCFDVVAEKLKTKLVSDFSVEPNQLTQCGWEDEGFILDNSIRIGVALRYSIKFKKIRKDGTLFANQTTETIRVHLTFCPFCGKPNKEADGLGVECE